MLKYAGNTFLLKKMSYNFPVYCTHRDIGRLAVNYNDSESFFGDRNSHLQYVDCYTSFLLSRNVNESIICFDGIRSVSTVSSLHCAVKIYNRL